MVAIKKILVSSLCVAGMVQAQKKQDLIGDVIGDVAWPVAFDRMCKLYDTMYARLGWLLDAYYKGGDQFRCQESEVNLVLNNSGCSKGLIGVVNKFLWFVEFKKLQDYNDAVNAEVKCLSRFVTGN
jgi:hypothetical protein